MAKFFTRHQLYKMRNNIPLADVLSHSLSGRTKRETDVSVSSVLSAANPLPPSTSVPTWDVAFGVKSTSIRSTW